MLEFDLSHVKMRALAWGPRNGRLALCLHGFPDSADSWRSLAPILAENGLRVVAPYTRGYAPTSLADDGDYHMGALMSDVLELHRALGAPADAILIGHDWGAWTCNAIAALPVSPFAEHISLALPPIRAVDISAQGSLQRIKMLARQCRMSWYIMFFQLPLKPHRALARVIPRLWKDWSPRGADVSRGIADALAALPDDAHRHAAVAYYRAMFRFTRTSPAYADLHRYRFNLPRRPMLLLHGEEDGAMQVGYTRRVLESLPVDSRAKTLQRAGHFCHVDQPRAVAVSILNYLQCTPSITN
ncbi:alpha/beta fold hydrolase [Mycobacterium sp. E2479]|uniref:alpha/beta fold hydrolase n=1 Tax=Mycobacterium sp. E2479 TaxID=1834134 RepID=UPI0007FFBCBE|nr:alpha/beta hydrolase [Mycobacterium sp. E2479]OBH49299.1 alpha/beta hydrolase [Mycobacterium sp. E2479]